MPSARSLKFERNRSSAGGFDFRLADFSHDIDGAHMDGAMTAVPRAIIELLDGVTPPRIQIGRQEPDVDVLDPTIRALRPVILSVR